MMKKFFTLVLMGATVLSASAQYEGRKVLDNWSIGVFGGGVTPTTVPCSGFFNHTRAVGGIEVTKQITPVLGFSAEAAGGINTTGSSSRVDNISGMMLLKANVNNLFWGYKGSPRIFEVVAAGGAGMNHYFGSNAGHNGRAYKGANGNTFVAKAGLELNLNLGQDKAWTVGLRPAIVWDLEGGYERTDAQFNVNNSVLELTAGVTYHFKGSNKQHYMTRVRAYDQAEVDGLNAKVNSLRGQLGDKDAALNAAVGRVRQLEKEVSELRNRKTEVVKTVTNTMHTMSHSMEQTVTFRQGKSVVDAAQLPNVERVATFLKNHKKATVSIKGYASPEGSAEINARLARERAEAVKSILVNKYKIAAGRITAEGQGVGDMFSEPDWNRVSICTIDEAE